MMEGGRSLTRGIRSALACPPRAMPSGGFSQLAKGKDVFMTRSPPVPSRHVTDHQMRLFMQFRQSDSVASAAAKAAFSPATGHRISADPRLALGQKSPARSVAA